MLNALTIHSLAIIATVKSCVCMFGVFFFFVPLIRIEEIVKRNYKWKFTRRWVFYLPVPSLILWFYRSFYKLFKSNQSKGKFFPSCQVKRFCFRIEKLSACSLLQYRYMYKQFFVKSFKWGCMIYISTVMFFYICLLFCYLFVAFFVVITYCYFILTLEFVRWAFALILYNYWYTTEWI